MYELIYILECLSSGQGDAGCFQFCLDLYPAVFGRKPHLPLIGVLEEGGEEVAVCGRNSGHFIQNILQFDGVETKNGVKYNLGRAMRISELTYLHLPPNGRLQFNLAMFGCFTIPVHRCQNNAMRFGIR